MDNRYITFTPINSGVSLSTKAWTLSKCDLSPPVLNTQYIEVPGRSTPLDLTEALALPTYKQRTLSVTLECSNNDRAYRKDLIKTLFTQIYGKHMEIVLPDFKYDQYIIGRPQIEVACNDMSHAIINITALCDPFIYSPNTIDTYTATNEETAVTIKSAGKMTVVPKITVSGEINIKFFEYDIGANPTKIYSYSLTDGTYILPTLTVGNFKRTIHISGNGTIKITHKVGELF